MNAGGRNGLSSGDSASLLRRQLEEKGGCRSKWAGSRKASGSLILVSWNRGRIIC